MNFDFPTIMVLAVFVTGAIWAVDIFVWAPKRRAQLGAVTNGGAAVNPAELEEKTERLMKEPILVEYSRSLFPVILIVLILRSFIVEPFRIPSGSMMPTLLVGDFILVNKFAYGIRLPVINTKIIDVGTPQRGDVFVFRYPKDPSTDYIKRVIGLPGDRISYFNKVVYVNGKAVEQLDQSVYQGVGSGIGMSGNRLILEKLGTVEHNILIDDNKPIMNGDFIVPEGEYFAMGDNRDNSNDSRFWGTVPQANLVGKAFMIWMNWDSNDNRIAWDRIGDSIK